MLRTINAEPTLWDAILPECCLGLPPGLADVDELLDDPRFFAPFAPFFTVRTGRPSLSERSSKPGYAARKELPTCGSSLAQRILRRPFPPRR